MDNRPQVKTKRVDVNDFLEPGNDGARLGNPQPSPNNQNMDNQNMNNQNINNQNQQGYAPDNSQQGQQQNNRTSNNHLKNKKSNKKSAGPNKVMIVVITIVIILSIAIIGIVGTRTLSQLNNKGDSNNVENTDTSINVDASTPNTDVSGLSPSTGTGDLEPGTGSSGLAPGNSSSNSITPGMTNTAEDTTMDQTSAPEEDNMVKDLNGISLIQNYTVGEITTVVDFVNYKKHRAITADGMELLWLEVDYKGKPYKVTVPFKIYKELDPEGITVVDIEVLNLGNGNQVISYMSVRSDYKSKLENGLR